MHLTCYADGGSKKKNNNPFKLSLLTAKHENNKAYPVILQQTGTEMPLMALSPLPDSAKLGQDAVLLSGPIHTAGISTESPLLCGDVKLWPHSTSLFPWVPAAPDVWHSHTELWAPSQHELMGAPAKAEHVAGVELTPVQPGKTPKLHQGCAEVGLPPKVPNILHLQLNCD